MRGGGINAPARDRRREFRHNSGYSIRSWSHADSTRVIVETTGPFEYRADSASNPERLFFDILHATPWIAHRRYATADRERRAGAPGADCRNGAGHDAHCLRPDGTGDIIKSAGSMRRTAW